MFSQWLAVENGQEVEIFDFFAIMYTGAFLFGAKFVTNGANLAV